jgi:hypothetical protein
MREKLLFGFKGNTFSAITQVCVTQLSLSPATFALTGNRAGTEPAPTHQHDKVEKGTGKVGEKPAISRHGGLNSGWGTVYKQMLSSFYQDDLSCWF